MGFLSFLYHNLFDNTFKSANPQHNIPHKKSSGSQVCSFQCKVLLYYDDDFPKIKLIEILSVFSVKHFSIFAGLLKGLQIGGILFDNFWQRNCFLQLLKISS